jgi:multicomponent Na+:H+ antiporter subunit D
MIEALFSTVPAGIFLIISGLLLPVLPRQLRSLLMILVPALLLAAIWQLDIGARSEIEFLGMHLQPVNVTTAGRLFATIFLIMTVGGNLFAMRQPNNSELSAANIYAGSAVCVTMAGDLVSMFIFWELMAVASTLVIWSQQTKTSRRSGMRYLLMHLLGGVILMAGIAGHIATTGSIAMEAMKPDSLANILILVGFLVNAGAPPFSAWLPDAYPEASYSGTVFLSAYTTKTAVYVLLVCFPGSTVLIPVGLYMIFYGIIYALLENDMRRILAYSIINQVGFMVTGIGIGTEMALNGAAAHAFSHIIYKALLLMAAGSVLLQTGKRKCTDLGGLFQSMPLTALFGIIGALSISAFPLTSGFISKSMVSQAAADQHLLWAWFLLAAASAGVFLHAGIKFPWFVFFQKDSGLRPADPPWEMKLSMLFFSVLCIAIGIWPEYLYRILPWATDYEPYTGAHVVAQVQLLLFSGLAFFVMLPLMKRTLTISLDTDWFWRKPGLRLVTLLMDLFDSLSRHSDRLIKHSIILLGKLAGQHHGPDGVIARSWRTGSTVLWVAILFMVFLIVYLFR